MIGKKIIKFKAPELFLFRSFFFLYFSYILIKRDKKGEIYMDKVIIKGTINEELTSEDYDILFDILMQLGVENIEIKIEE